MAKKILIVDDDIDTLKLVGMMLEQKGYEILATSNGKKAIEMATANLPDLILLDVMMPQMDGYEVSRKLRANPETEPIPLSCSRQRARLMTG
ncbi:MAG: Response regulator PleD [Chloroflexi bacterium]|nr:Response regulator PleD [Chloroflexota bacterium]